MPRVTRSIISFRSALVLASSILLAVLSLFLILSSNPPLLSTVAVLVLPLLHGLAAASLFYAAHRSKVHSQRLCLAWGTLALGALAYTLGGVFAAVITTFFRRASFPSIADGFYLSYYLLFLGGVILLPGRPTGPSREVKAWMDMGVVMLAALLLSWNVLLGPTIAAGPKDPLMLSLSLGYLTADLGLLWALLVLVFRRIGGHTDRPLCLLAGGAVAMILSDSSFYYRSLSKTYSVGSPMDIGWVVAFLLFMLAGILQANTIRPQPPVEAEIRSKRGNWPTYLPYAWVGGVFFLLLWSHDHPLPMSFHKLLLATGGIIGLLLLRQIITIHENLALSRQLRSELLERTRAEEELRRARDELELRVAERTAQLAEINEGLLLEVAQRRQAEEALRESESRYRAIMEQSADGIFLLDPETRRIVEANAAFQRMLGYSAQEIVGLSQYDFVAVERTVVDQRFEELLRTKAPLSDERQYRRKDGSLVDAWVNRSLISYGGKEVVCTLVRDLTEKKALEAQSLRAQRMESIGMLAGGISHDLNNILAPILMGAELLEQRVSDPESLKMLSSISANAQRGADIVKQILTFSRGMEGDRSPLSPRYLLKEMDNFIRETFPKTLEIKTEIPKDLWTISGNTTQLHQVLMNLCVNARDAVPEGGTLTLSAQNLRIDQTYARMHPEAEPGSYVVLAVSDTGKGIPAPILPQIFDPFFTTKEKGKGTGLGLSVAYSIVKGHGGFIEVESEVGRGSRFRVWLPASPSLEGAPAQEGEKPSLPCGKGELILVVEDEASVREVIQATLEAHGYRVATASDGSEAVALYAQHQEEIQAVITDMAMPIMDGLATIRALQRIQPAVRVIAVSGMAWDKPVAEAIGNSVKAFLQKPFTAETLLRNVAEVLREPEE